MRGLRFLKEDGHGKLYDESGVEVTSKSVERQDDLKSLLIYGSYIISQPPQALPEKPERPKLYQSYDDTTKRLFFHYRLQDGLSIRAAALKAGVKESTGRGWYHTYLKDPHHFTFQKQTNLTQRPKLTLTQIHRDALLTFYQQKPQATVLEATQHLNQCFPELNLKRTRVYHLIRHTCPEAIQRASPTPIDPTPGRIRWARQWPHLDFLTQCVFLDEHTIGSYTLAVALSSVGLIHLALKTVRPFRILDFNQFLSRTLEVLDRFDQVVLVLDQASVHDGVAERLESSRYRSVYLPPYSKDLNPADQFWDLLRSRLKQSKDSKFEKAVIEATSSVSPEQVQSMILYCKYRLEDSVLSLLPKQ